MDHTVIRLHEFPLIVRVLGPILFSSIQKHTKPLLPDAGADIASLLLVRIYHPGPCNASV
jgi:hypothetical protein